MERKVKVWYRVDLQTGYQRTRYKTKTVRLEIPTNNYGFTLMRTLSENVKKHFAVSVIPNMDNVASFRILSFDILQEV